MAEAKNWIWTTCTVRCQDGGGEDERARGGEDKGRVQATKKSEKIRERRWSEDGKEGQNQS